MAEQTLIDEGDRRARAAWKSPDARRSFSGETADSLTVSWSEPENTGPDIDDYDVQYREKGDKGRFTVVSVKSGPGLTLTLTDLEPGTVYEAQVRARNEEGTGGWSESGRGDDGGPP